MAYQFTRIELYSRKGKDGRGTDFIFSEVSREAGACLHVANPKPPTVVFGESIERLKAIHDERAASAKTSVNGKSKAIRKDQNTLGTVIVSHPASVLEYNRDPAIQADVKDWEQRSVAWLKSLYGDELVCVVRHLDESHPHLHAYLIPIDDQMRAGKFHPGFNAKNAVKAAGMKTGEDEKALSKRSDRAYVEAMQLWLDGFHRDVAIPCGLTRIGPGKRRLTRAQWHQEQTQAKALKTTVGRARKVRTDGEAHIERVKQRAAEIMANANKEAAQASLMQQAALAAQDKASEDQREADARLLKAHKSTGWAGWLRLVWDKLRESKIAAKVSTQVKREMATEINRWRIAASNAERRRIDAERRSQENLSKLELANERAVTAQIERDRLRLVLQPSPIGATDGPSAPSMVFKPPAATMETNGRRPRG